MCEFELHRSRGNASGQAITHVSIQPIKGQITGPCMGKDSFQHFERGIQPPNRPPLIDGVIVTDHLHQISKGSFFQVRPTKLPLAHFGKPLLEDLDGIRSQCGAGGFSITLPPPVVLNPPGSATLEDHAQTAPLHQVLFLVVRPFGTNSPVCT